MARRHSVIRGIPPEARVFGDVIAPHDAFTAEGRREYGCVSRHRKALECLARDAGERVKRVAFTLRVEDVVEKRAELRMTGEGRFFGHALDDGVEIEATDGEADPKERLVRLRLDALFLGEEAGLGDVLEAYRERLLR